MIPEYSFPLLFLEEFQEAVKKAFAETDIYVSPALLKEYRDVPLMLGTKKKLTPIQIKALVSGLATFVTITIVVWAAGSDMFIDIKRVT